MWGVVKWGQAINCVYVTKKSTTRTLLMTMLRGGKKDITKLKKNHLTKLLHSLVSWWNNADVWKQNPPSQMALVPKAFVKERSD